MTPTGASTWTFRYRPQGSTSFKRLKLGNYPEVSLATARDRAEMQRVAVSGGADPQGEIKYRREASANVLTFAKLAEEYIERYAKQHKRSWDQDALLLRAHVLGQWAARPVEKITRADAAALLDRIAAKAPSSANRTHTVIAKVFNWAVDSGMIAASPMARMKKHAKEKPKERVLSPAEIRVMWRVVENETLSPSVTAALRFLLLSGLRPGEVAGVSVQELRDLDSNSQPPRIDIPGERMKGKKPHIAPLAPMALQIVRGRLAEATEGQTHVFASYYAKRGAIARHSLSQALKRIIPELIAVGDDADAIRSLQANPPTPHDFRRTIATGLSALGIPREDRKAVLAQTEGDVMAIHYDKYDRFEEKRRALELWETHIAQIIDQSSPDDDAVQLRGRK